MANDANTKRLKRMHSRAKAIIRAHPNTSYRVALAKAGKEVRSGKKVSGKKRSAPSKKKAAPRKARRVGSISYKGGSVKLGSIAHTKKHLKDQLKEKLAWELLAKESASTARTKKKATKKVTETRRELRAIGGLK